MLLLCVLWGGQQSVIKLVAHDMAPTLQISLRSGIGLSFKKGQAHTALADVLESIDELEHYREHFMVAPKLAEA